mmetsp:Transcript_18817/g.54425  ORF Transcript_18817/g.54425 Transcript_18817/m.54425 type:complete len:222 (-) Transcript_18817:883-1548(-)
MVIEGSLILCHARSVALGHVRLTHVADVRRRPPLLVLRSLQRRLAPVAVSRCRGVVGWSGDLRLVIGRRDGQRGEAPSAAAATGRRDPGGPRGGGRRVGCGALPGSAAQADCARPLPRPDHGGAGSGGRRRAGGRGDAFGGVGAQPVVHRSPRGTSGSTVAVGQRLEGGVRPLLLLVPILALALVMIQLGAVVLQGSQGRAVHAHLLLHLRGGMRHISRGV